MKKLLFLAPVLLLLAVFGCSKKNVLDELLTFNVDVSQTNRISPPYVVFTALPKPVTVITNSAAAFNNNSTTKDKVKDVYLDQIKLTLLGPEVLDFDFLQELRVFINTPGVNNRILLAQITNPPQNGSATITLVPTTARLDEYLKAEKYELTVYSITRPTYGNTQDSLTVRTDTRYRVTANRK